MTPEPLATTSARAQLAALAEDPTFLRSWPHARGLPAGDPAATRPAAVLVLFGVLDGLPAAHDAQALALSHDLDVLLLARAATLRSHAGQVAFPGGRLEPGESVVEAALREAEEETGLDPRGVQLFAVLPRLFIPVSDFVVTPVLGWWREPSPVGVVDPNETARVFTVPVADLTDPANRVTAIHPSGHRGPAFLVESALVWGFTAGVIDRILHFAGWERPWDRSKQVPLDWRA